MAVNFTTLFTRLGGIFGGGEEQHALPGIANNVQTTLATRLETIKGDYTDLDKDMITNLLDSEQLQTDAITATMTQFIQAAQKTLIDMMDEDSPLPSKTVNAALVRLRDQMIAGSETVNGANNGYTLEETGSSNTGNGTLAFANSDPLWTGGAVGNDNQQYVQPEDIRFSCSADAQVTGTGGRETFTLRGERNISNVNNPNWPDGSGQGNSLRVTDPSEDAQKAVGRNILTNSDFEDFTSDVPDSWTIITGTAGVDIFEETGASNNYRGSSSLRFLGDVGGTLHNIEQNLPASVIKPKTKYGIAYQVISDTGASAGRLRVSVKDSSNNVISQTGYTAAVASPATTFGTYEYTEFNTGEALADGLKIVVEATTAVPNTQNFYIDDLCMFEFTQFGGAHGWYVNIIAGSDNFVIDDFFRTRQAFDNAAKFQLWFNLAFNMRSQTQVDGRTPLILPYDMSAGETISDGLVT